MNKISENSEYIARINKVFDHIGLPRL